MGAQFSHFIFKSNTFLHLFLFLVEVLSSNQPLLVAVGYATYVLMTLCEAAVLLLLLLLLLLLRVVFGGRSGWSIPSFGRFSSSTVWLDSTRFTFDFEMGVRVKNINPVSLGDILCPFGRTLLHAARRYLIQIRKLFRTESDLRTIIPLRVFIDMTNVFLLSCLCQSNILPLLFREEELM
jgi:hypothetical protein